MLAGSIISGHVVRQGIMVEGRGGAELLTSWQEGVGGQIIAPKDMPQ
jgi:hypothetical protein